MKTDLIKVHDLVDELICDCYDEYAKKRPEICNRCKAIEIIEKLIKEIDENHHRRQ